MKFRHPASEIIIPDGLPVEEGLARTTHLGIGAHQDDLEIMAIDGILKCFQRQDKWFTGVVVTNGGGSPRTGTYQETSDEEMMTIRVKEQEKAAFIGEYGAQVFLAYPSAQVKAPGNSDPVEDLKELIRVTSPEVIYTHNLADKHPSHISVVVKVINAIRELPEAYRPHWLYGCEVWRDLDWMMDEDKVVFDCSQHKNLQSALLGVFDSQISGGKRYDLAAMGRRVANATYYATHETDETTGLAFGMDLTPLIQDEDADIMAYVGEFVDRFYDDVEQLLGSVT
jgi:LmbE family N-acetylglucosaminyl deacetylase